MYNHNIVIVSVYRYILILHINIMHAHVLYRRSSSAPSSSLFSILPRFLYTQNVIRRLT